MPHGDRIILRREDGDIFAAVDGGGHEIYEEWERRDPRRS